VFFDAMALAPAFRSVMMIMSSARSGPAINAAAIENDSRAFRHAARVFDNFVQLCDDPVLVATLARRFYNAVHKASQIDDAGGAIYDP
jgi:hypothetical protein